MERPSVLNIERAGCDEERRAPGFWRRQFQQQATGSQVVFDWLFGIALPVLCFIFDPIVFRGNFFLGAPLLGQLQFLAYAVALIEISMLLIWLCRRECLGAHAVAVGGFLYAGALISLLIGIVILPFSLLGIAFGGIGILGFTPFMTAIVFWRNGRRAVNLHPAGASRARQLGALALGLVFAVGGPLAAHLKISRLAQDSLSKVIEGDAREMEAAAEQLRLIGYATNTNTDKIVRAYQSEQDQTRRERLARAYMKITGQDIEMRSTYLFD